MKQPPVGEEQLMDPKANLTTDLEAPSSAVSGISGLLEADQLLSTSLDRAMELLDAQKGAIHLLDPDGQQLTLHSQRGLSPEYVARHPKISMGEQAAGRVADIRRPILISDSAGGSAAAPIMGGEQFRTLVCVPLLSKARVLGTLTLLDAAHGRLEPEDLRVLDFFARQITVSVEVARLFAEKERRVKELAAVNEISQAIGSTLDPVQVLKIVATRTAQTCAAERCSILLLDKDSSTLVPMMSQFASGLPDDTLWEVFRNTVSADKVDDIPVIASVIRHGETIFLDSDSISELPRSWVEPFGIKSLLLVPLVTREEIIGLIALDNSIEAHAFSAWQVELAATIGNQVAIAIENASLYGRQKKRTVQLDVINQVGRRATSSLDLDELLQETANAIQEAFDYQFVSILVIDQETSEVVQLADVTCESYMHIPGYRQSIHEGLIGWAVREGEALVVNDVSQDPRYLEGFPDAPFTRSELVVPIRIGAQVVGALDVHSSELNAFDHTDLMSMQAIAGQLAVSMRNARLYEEIKSHLADLEATNRQLVAIQQAGASLARTLDLHKLLQNVADSVVRGLGYSAAAIGVVEPDEMMVENIAISGLGKSQLQELERIAGTELAVVRLALQPDCDVLLDTLSTGRTLTTDRLDELFGSVFDEGRARAVKDLLALGTMVTVPLVLDHRPLGVLIAASQRDQEVGREELATLQALANQATLAIENAQLYERTRARLDELSALHEISVAAASTWNLNEILDRIVGSLQGTLGFSALAIMLINEEEQRLSIAAGAGYSADVTRKIEPRLGEGITGRVALSGEALNVPDVTVDSRYIVGNENVRSEVCVPLAVGNRIIGVLNVESDRRAAFSQDTVRFLSTLAGHLAVVIENARLFQRIAQGENDWQKTFSAIRDGIAVYDTELRIVRANPALADMLNMPLDELVGKRCFEIFSYCTDPAGPSCPHRRAIETGGPASIEFEEPRLGKTLHALSYPVFDEDGRSKGTVHTVRDITADKTLRAQLLQTEKLAAIGELVSGVAHELNNPLTSVMGYAQLLQSADVSPGVRADLQTIYQEAQRSARIIDNLLTFARKETAEKRYTDINQILRDTADLRSYQFKVDNIELKREFQEQLPWTMVAPQQLQQVVLNLLNNAHQALMERQSGRQVTVRSETDGKVIRIKVIDNGPGIPQEYLSKVFDPFFTTKDVGQGTGLGLSIAFGVVQEHGGRIWAESEPDKGAVFTVELPIVAHPMDSVQQSSQPEATPTHIGRRILLVDDEVEILEVIARILERMGHLPVAVDSAEKALEKLQRDSYDLIICDVRMPGLGGKGLYQKVRSTHPELAKRVIFTTGDTLSPSTRAFLESAGTPTVPKPFMIEDLQRAIHDLLDE
jgi:two-component system NtrC family sensor kinase